LAKPVKNPESTTWKAGDHLIIRPAGRIFEVIGSRRSKPLVAIPITCRLKDRQRRTTDEDQNGDIPQEESGQE
jgi:hypothetical protein